ncbi:hypothetical protein FQB35_15130 [Crassaminicella thermophila]|uniref:Uncharacterized protein n=1 Tax=Crassaminicella thermophila TaxID=2599308 RepID=A0A5C0SJX7_CRATE|nr:hypothetical protein [Crassaminicella thermophila]QEK13488.1 hypothetical protein FQB35_15130 [Crassaminicella thermophila]
MKRSIITSALVLVILGASATTGYAAYKPFPSYIYSINANKDPIEIISPKGDIIVQDSLLISVQVRDDVSVSLSVYKEDTEETEDTLIFGPEKVDKGESLKFYNKQLKDLSPGKYRMEFDIKDKDGNEEEPIIKYFTVKNKEDEMNESLERIPKTKVTNILNKIIEQLGN